MTYDHAKTVRRFWLKGLAHMLRKRKRRPSRSTGVK